MTTPENSAQLLIDGKRVPGFQNAKLTIFGEGAVKGIAEVALENRNLSEERFHVNDLVIPIIGHESFVRTSGFQVKTRLDMFDYVRMMQPPGLITFGVNNPNTTKPYGTHMDIFLRAYAEEGMLSVAVEGVYDDDRDLALRSIASLIGSRAINLTRTENDIHISTLKESGNENA